MANGNFFKHLPTMLLGVVVAVILLIAVFTYQLNQTESAVVVTMGTPSAVTEPGLHFRLPFPFQKVHKFDHRIRCFEGSTGRIEETMTADRQNILVGVYVNYRIEDVESFFKAFETMTKAEERLNSVMRSAKSAIFGQYRFNQVNNTNADLMKLGEIQDKIRDSIARDMEPSGLKIISVGINSINVPKEITEKVFERMIADRNVEAERFLSEGNRESNDIRNKADQSRTEALANAEARARIIRAEGDSEAAKYYSVFQQNPELAQFLRKLDSLRAVMQNQTTLVIDTNTVPFDLFKPGADIIGPVNTPAAPAE